MHGRNPKVEKSEMSRDDADGKVVGFLPGQTIQMFETPGEGEPDPEMREALINRIQGNDINLLAQQINRWANEQFPGRTRSGMFLKLYSEIGELVDAKPEDEAMEMADIFIMLLDYAAIKGTDLGWAIRAKMDINMKREWMKTPAGNWRHVK